MNHVHRVVFPVSASLILGFVLFGAFAPEAAWTFTSGTKNFIATNLGWLYTASMAFFLGFALWLLFSPYGDLKLGKPHESPKYPYLSWFAMLFSAGIGIGLFYWGVSEPMSHYTAPPRATPETVEAARDAITITIFHWGLHGWALYVIVGLSLAYFGYRKDLPLTFRSTLYPILGDGIDGPIGDLFEILAVFATMFGVATSLGLGVLHVNAGLVHMGWVAEVDIATQLVIIAVITLVATISVVSGLDRGIRRLSELNFGLGVILLLFVFIAGPTGFLIGSFFEAVGHYGQNLIWLSFVNDAYQLDSTWYEDWTLFYWGWWIAWSPFVGMFIAQISRGRTLREFVLGVLFVPTIFIVVWMVVFGNTGIYLEHYGDGGVAQALAGDQGTFMAFYAMLDQLPFSEITIAIATLSGAIYFVSSSDSASLIIDILTSEDDVDPPVGQRIFWAVTEGAVAGTLLAAGGRNALNALQYASIAAALPFCLVVLAICYSLVKALREEDLDGTDGAETGEP